MDTYKQGRDHKSLKDYVSKMMSPPAAEEGKKDGKPAEAAEEQKDSKVSHVTLDCLGRAVSFTGFKLR